MDNTYDLSRLDREEKFELRRIQRKLRDVNRPRVRHRNVEEEPEDLERLTLEEMIQYSELLRKLQGLPSAYAHIIDPIWPDGEHRTLRTPRHPKTPDSGVIAAAVYVPAVASRAPDSGVTAAPEPVAVAPAPATVKPSAPATPVPAEKPKLPADSVLSAARQLDSIMRFGYDLPEEPR